MWDVWLNVCYGVGVGLGIMTCMGVTRLAERWAVGKDTLGHEINMASVIKLEERNEIGRRQLVALEGIWGELARVRGDADRVTKLYEDELHDIGGEAGGA